MGEFAKSLTGRVILRVDEVERAMLTSLTEQVIEFVTPEPHGQDIDPLYAIVGISPELEVPDDPAFRRLFPDAYLDDVEASADFRRFTQRGLQDMKAQHARTVAACVERSGDKITISKDEVPSWLGFLNDSRLAIGSRLAISEDSREEFEELDEEDPRFAMFQIYDWLTYLQDSLMRILLPDA